MSRLRAPSSSELLGYGNHLNAMYQVANGLEEPVGLGLDGLRFEIAWHESVLKPYYIHQIKTRGTSERESIVRAFCAPSGAERRRVQRAFQRNSGLVDSGALLYLRRATLREWLKALIGDETAVELVGFDQVVSDYEPLDESGKVVVLAERTQEAWMAVHRSVTILARLNRELV